MATATIGVYEDAKEVPYGVPIEVQTVTFTGTPGESAAIAGDAGKMMRVRVVPDANCKFAVGEAPDTSVTGQFQGAFSTEYWGIRAGHKIEFVTV